MQHFVWYYSSYDLTESLARCEAETAVNPYDFRYMIACLALIFAKHYLCT